MKKSTKTLTSLLFGFICCSSFADHTPVLTQPEFTQVAYSMSAAPAMSPASVAILAQDNCEPNTDLPSCEVQDNGYSDSLLMSAFSKIRSGLDQALGITSSIASNIASNIASKAHDAYKAYGDIVSKAHDAYKAYGDVVSQDLALESGAEKDVLYKIVNDRLISLREEKADSDAEKEDSSQLALASGFTASDFTAHLMKNPEIRAQMNNLAQYFPQSSDAEKDEKAAETDKFPNWLDLGLKAGSTEGAKLDALAVSEKCVSRDILRTLNSNLNLQNNNMNSLRSAKLDNIGALFSEESDKFNKKCSTFQDGEIKENCINLANSLRRASNRIAGEDAKRASELLYLTSWKDNKEAFEEYNDMLKANACLTGMALDFAVSEKIKNLNAKNEGFLHDVQDKTVNFIESRNQKLAELEDKDIELQQGAAKKAREEQRAAETKQRAENIKKNNK